jgi:hypothetical protein
MNTSTPAADSSSNGDGRDTTMDGNNQIGQDLPFIVTHWLANYNKNNGNGNNKETARTASTTTTTNTAVDDLQTIQRRAEAMAKIRKASSDIASAFASLGAFGTTTRVRQRTFHHRIVFLFFVPSVFNISTRLTSLLVIFLVWFYSYLFQSINHV